MTLNLFKIHSILVLRQLERYLQKRHNRDFPLSPTKGLSQAGASVRKKENLNPLQLAACHLGPPNQPSSL